MLPDLHPLTHYLTEWIMAFGWTAVVVYTVFAVYKMRIYGLLVIGFISLPWAIFYLWAWFDWFPSTQFAVSYSRLCGLNSIVGLLIGVHMMMTQTSKRTN